MSERKEIKLLWDVLQNRGKWYIDPYAPDNPQHIDIAEKAKCYASDKLMKMSARVLYDRYKKWKDSSPLLLEGRNYYDSFLDDLLFGLGLEVLNTEERFLFNDSCYLIIRWLN